MLVITDLLFKVLVGVSVLGLLIFVHELGHFLFAKMFKVGVLEFSIGFGRKIWSKRIGETRYSLGLIPLGGYVRMVGDDPYSLEENQLSESEDEEPEEDEASMPGMAMQDVDMDDPAVKHLMEDRSRWFLSQGLFARSMIVLAGPGFNFLFGWVLAVFLFFHFGTQEVLNKPQIDTVEEGMPAEKSGILAGDRVLSIDGIAVETWQQLAKTVMGSAGKPLEFRVQREEDGVTVEKSIILSGEEESDDAADAALVVTGKRSKAYLVGIRPVLETKHHSLTTSMYYAGFYVYRMSDLSLRGFYYVVSGMISVKNMGGPISIVKHAGDSAKKGVDWFLRFIIFLSVSLAVLNLLPIPVLDGGHLVFFLVEGLLGGPIKLEVQQLAHQVGMLLLILLMLFAVGMDLLRVIGVLSFAS